jgi:ATP-binding cassette, subfamily B (MDR/TAP), member 1
MHKY